MTEQKDTFSPEEWNAIEPDYSVHISDGTDDVVEHPAHYTGGRIECIEAIEVMTDGMTGWEGYSLGNVLKYIWRFRRKGGVQDLKKAKWYLENLIESKRKA